MAQAHTVDDKAFLDLFPRPERSTVANIFLNAIRQTGLDTPGSVLQGAMDDVGRRTRQADDYARQYRGTEWGQREVTQAEKYRRWTTTVHENFDSALVYAGWCLWYESLPRTEREKVKRGERSQQLSEEPATDPQKRYLQVLGYQGDVGGLSKREASDLITQLKAGA